MENKKYENAVSAEIAKKLKDGFIEITVPEDKAEIFKRIITPEKLTTLETKNLDELFNTSKVVSGVIFEDPRPEERRVYVDRVIYFPNFDYDRIMEDAREYASNQPINEPLFYTDAEVFVTQIDSGELTSEELAKIQKTPSYSYYIKHAKKDSSEQSNSKPTQPGDEN